MTITTEDIKKLRDVTGVSIMQCKKALEEAEGDQEKAVILLRKQSNKAADKKADRTLASGTVATYNHPGNFVGTMVELFCETDFVAKNDEFQALAKDIAMQVAATSPEYVSPDQISDEQKEKAKEVFAEEVKDKPQELQEQILQGKLDTFFAEKTLTEQPFIKNPDVTVGGLLKEATQKFGERVAIGKIARFSAME